MTVQAGGASPTEGASSDHVVIFDTTLRDGEQSPGATMTFDEKLQVAELLDAMGVDIIEAGFPIASEGDFEAVSEIARRTKNAVVAGLARAGQKDVERAGEAVRHARRPRIHTFISTSPVHMKWKLQKEPHEVLDLVVASVTRARALVDDVEWSAEDATRTEHDFLCRCCEAAIKAGATTINIPDTVGYSVPEEYAALITMLRTKVPGADKVVFSTHCHNDLGLAVANSLAGVAAGARQVECTINGLGERAGNAALEEIVMAVRTRADIFPCETGIDTTEIVNCSKLVSNITGFNVQPNKAIVGANAFAHESGIHQDGVIKSRETYEIMRAQDVGWHTNRLVLGKHSGRNAFKTRLKELGYEFPGEEKLNETFQRFKELADKKHDIFDEDLQALVTDSLLAGNERIRFQSLKVLIQTGETPAAEVVVSVDGVEKPGRSTGDGPVDAVYRALGYRRATGDLWVRP